MRFNFRNHPSRDMLHVIGHLVSSHLFCQDSDRSHKGNSWISVEYQGPGTNRYLENFSRKTCHMSDWQISHPRRCDDCRPIWMWVQWKHSTCGYILVMRRFKIWHAHVWQLQTILRRQLELDLFLQTFPSFCRNSDVGLPGISTWEIEESDLGPDGAYSSHHLSPQTFPLHNI